MQAAIIGALVLAALSTLGDFVWANWHVRHLALYGVLHGMAIFMAIGFILGVRRGMRRGAAGALLGVIAGALAAGSFYAMRPLLGYSAMFASWMLVWIALGVIGTMLSAPNDTIIMNSRLLRRALTRGLAAALLSGAAFYAVSGMWMPLFRLYRPGAGNGGMTRRVSTLSRKSVAAETNCSQAMRMRSSLMTSSWVGIRPADVT